MRLAGIPEVDERLPEMTRQWESLGRPDYLALLDMACRQRDTIDALMTRPAERCVVAVRILAALSKCPGVVIPGDERLVGVVVEAMEGRTE